MAIGEVRAESRLRGSLELLFTDEPVLDLYASALWAVPTSLVDELSARIDTLVADRRSSRLTVGRHPGIRTPAPAVVADVLGIVGFLCGDAALRAGSRLRLEHDLVERFRAGALDAPDPTVRWVAPASSWRPPGGRLFRAAGDDRELRQIAWDLTVETLRALDGLAPLEARRQAVMSLYDTAADDDELIEASLTTPYVRPAWSRLEDRWADLATDDVVRVLPELTGPVGYLSWVVDGWIAAHERLVALVPGGGDTIDAFLALLAQAGITAAPAELAVGIRGEIYAQVREQLPVMESSWDAEGWRRQVRDWLARALVAGQLELCRAWLDLAVRLTGAVQGLPGTPVSPRPCLVPIAWFQEDVRRLFRVRRVRHPLTGTSAMPGWVGAEDAFAVGPQPLGPWATHPSDDRDRDDEDVADERADSSTPVLPEQGGDADADDGADDGAGPGTAAARGQAGADAGPRAPTPPRVDAGGPFGGSVAGAPLAIPDLRVGPGPSVPGPAYRQGPGPGQGPGFRVPSEPSTADSTGQTQLPPGARGQHPAPGVPAGQGSPGGQGSPAMPPASRRGESSPAGSPWSSAPEEHRGGLVSAGTGPAPQGPRPGPAHPQDRNGGWYSADRPADPPVGRSGATGPSGPGGPGEPAGPGPQPSSAGSATRGTPGPAAGGGTTGTPGLGGGAPSAGPADGLWNRPDPPSPRPDPPSLRPDPPSPRPDPPSPRAEALSMIDSIVGQPALVTALREVMTAPEQDLHLLVAGPHGTGRSLSVDVLTRILASRGFDPTLVQLSPEQVVRLDEAAAVTHVRERVEGCVGERLLVIDALDELVADEVVGGAVADELHRLLSIYTAELQIIAFTASDGYRKLVDVSPALAAWWRVVRTRDLDAADFATIFGRVVEQRGATTTEVAARRAGDMLAATPAEGRLRNARLATYLAEMAVEAARRRTDGSAVPLVEVLDLPQLEFDPDQTEASAAVPPGSSFSRLGRTR